MSPNEAFKHAVGLAGGQTKFGRIVGASQQRIWNLLNDGKVMPAEWVIPAEEFTGVSRHILRPDIYPPGEAVRKRKRAVGE